MWRKSEARHSNLVSLFWSKTLSMERDSFSVKNQKLKDLTEYIFRLRCRYHQMSDQTFQSPWNGVFTLKRRLHLETASPHASRDPAPAATDLRHSKGRMLGQWNVRCFVSIQLDAGRDKRIYVFPNQIRSNNFISKYNPNWRWSQCIKSSAKAEMVLLRPTETIPNIM